MSRRAGALALGTGAILVGWWLGTPPIVVAGLGLTGAALSAWAFELIVDRRLDLERDVAAAVLEEGDSIAYVVRPRRRLLLGSYILRDRFGPVELEATRLSRSGTTPVAIPEVPRGRHRLGPGEVVVSDPLGLAVVRRQVPGGPTVLVRPRIPMLDGLFTDGRGVGAGGTRGASSRAAGTEFRGIREYRDGEPLRAVHWASTARRGQLMVRDLEEPPHEEVAVVLDLDESSEIGPPGRSSIDAAVRAAGAVARAELRAGRAPFLVLAAKEPTVLRLAEPERDWLPALDALAAATSSRDGCALALLGGGRTPLGHARQVVLVSARAHDPLLEALERREGAIAVVAVDAPSFAGVQVGPDPALLRLAARHVPVTVVRAGDDLRDVLGRHGSAQELASA